MTAPTVYFIDDSATMREVIKIAFRRENINVIACHDAASALQQMEQAPPNVVISDVIMPDKDGYEVCQHLKQHPQLHGVPVILMSGVVNRSVAEKAFAVKADELIRKPFQPQDLISRVKTLLSPKAAVPAPAVDTSAALSSIFAAPSAASQAKPGNGNGHVPAPAPAAARAAAAPAPAAVIAPPQEAPRMRESAVAVATAPQPAPMPTRAAVSGSMDTQKLRFEISRLEKLVKKLQSELQAEREYAEALEAHVRTLQEAE